MRKTVLFVFFAVLGLTSTWAFDFSAVAPTGQTLYYNITSPSNHTVSVTYPHPTMYWLLFPEPTGSLTIPSTVNYDNTTYTVTSIGIDAFDGCDSLTSVTIANSVTSIEDFAFFGCSNLTSVTIPNSVTTIGSDVFYDCMKLTNVTIPNSVTSIGSNAFCHCFRLVNLPIPNSVTSIGEDAFYLVRNILYDGTASGSPWGALSVNGYEEGDLFYADNTKTHLAGCKASATSVTIPNSVISIGNDAFSCCSGIPSITIPNSVTSIGDEVFSNCSGITNITIPNSVTSIGDGAFEYCSSLTNVTIPNSITSIGDEFFYGCTHLTNVTIPNSVTSIGNEAFHGCKSLTNFVIPNAVTSIGDAVFEYCYDLTSVTIGSSVTSIGNEAFSGCLSLNEIISRPSVAPSLGTDVFYRVADTIPVYVPCGNSESYDSQWEYFSNFVETVDFSFQAVSSNTAQGSVSVLQRPTCSDSIAVVQAIPASGYQFDHWSNGETQNPYTLTVTSDTLITAVFSSQGGPANIDDAMWTAYETLAEQGTIVVKNAEGEGVRVFDVAGRLHYQGRVTTTVWRLDVSTAGIYFVQIGNTPTQKVVVVR